MNPSQAASRDWRLYYHGTMMLHDKKGIGNVSVEDGVLYFRQGRGKWTRTNAECLSCLWPEPQTINTQKGAAYVGRRSRREARRSFTAGHYYIKWGSVSNSTIQKYMDQMINGFDYPTMDEAIEQILDGTKKGVAVTRELIIGPGLEVILRGKSVGELVDRSGEYLYRPTIEGCALARRASFKLHKEGILCL